MKKKLDFLFAGVGGQGTILASNIVSEVGMRCGYDIKKSEVHGMSQRGGAVESHVRWAEKVYSPLIEEGSADFLLAFEMLEAARWPQYMAPGSVVLVNNHRVMPPSVNLGQAQYPEVKEIESIMTAAGSQVIWVEGAAKAEELGNPALAGVVLLGVLSARLDEPVETWLQAVQDLVPAKFKELNVKAFLAGREMAAK
ncbi:indolepyruvate oxidoreductase subunit beta [Desulfoscipio gibsoniae]|uniref:2-oxoacid:ferredoxin oxidoreductase, gamma subunit n=1 Tax=Desulfoscipio gibsoniae DSM 7213 TaxID=767817 RepID=R4KDY8_9FIRM|nr:indolepyruvate oxidoreductase subunit beta [Desulfoscipio gibsoniae]AGL01388.1 2-oxoacid:ferredoxin oxidoreductase, gamma subunit [Desulfoscipio gibsoniae DSM 7213]